MLKKVAAVLFMGAFVVSLSVIGFAEEGRIEGRIVRSNKDKMTLTIHVHDTNTEKTVYYDASTKWVSQFHNDPKVNTIDASQVKDGDQVICLGTYDDKKEFHASTISKRLSHSQ